MRKVILICSISALLIFGAATAAISQEQPEPKKDTVNIDTDAKPEFYYAIEDEETESTEKSGGSGTTIAIIAGAVVLLGAGGYFLLKKKK
jgi:LPXTG-motif cell wall-anchored protein